MVAGWAYLDALSDKIINHPWAYKSTEIELPPTDFSVERSSPAQIPPHRSRKEC